MSRLTDIGPGLNSISMEFPTSVTGSPVIVTTPVRGGAYSIEFTPTAAEWVRDQYHTPNTQDVIFYRGYLRVHVAPTGTIPVMGGYHGGDANYKVGIRLTSGLLLQLWNQEDGAQIGSDSSALSLDTWYRVEWKIDTVTLASTVCEARAYADTAGASAFWNPSGTVNLTAAPDQLMVGSTATDATADFFICDLAVNNDNGSFENTWCGEAKGEVYLRPDSAGDGTPAWTPLSGANWDSVDENPPDEATSYVASNTSGQIDDYNLAATPAGIASNDVINCVLVGSRFRDSAATGADPSYVLRIKASASGTVEESADILADVSATWSTIDTSGTKTYKLVLYDLPGASTTAWTKADLDTTQIGLRESVTDTHFVWVTAVWLIIDYKASAGITVNLSAAALTASGQALTVTPGAVSTALSAAALAASGPQLTVTPGAVSLNMLAADLLAQGQVITPQPGAVSISLLAAALSALGQVITIDAGGQIQVNLSAAVLSALGQVITPQPGPVSVSLLAAALAAQGQTITPQPGAATVNLSAAALVAGGQVITPQPGPVSVSLSPATLIASGQVVTPQPGPVSISLVSAALAAQGQVITISAPSGTQVDLNTATLTATGQAISIQVGPVTLALLAAQLVASGQTLTVQTFTEIMLNAAALTAQGQITSVIPGAASVPLAPAQLSALGQPTSIISVVEVLLSAASLLASGQTLTPVPGAVSIGLSPALLLANAPQAQIVTFIQTLVALHALEADKNLTMPKSASMGLNASSNPNALKLRRP